MASLRNHRVLEQEGDFINLPPKRRVPSTASWKMAFPGYEIISRNWEVNFWWVSQVVSKSFSVLGETLLKCNLYPLNLTFVSSLNNPSSGEIHPTFKVLLGYGGFQPHYHLWCFLQIYLHISVFQLTDRSQNRPNILDAVRCRHSRKTARYFLPALDNILLLVVLKFSLVFGNWISIQLALVAVAQL